MARLIQHLVEPPHECMYLADREASLEIKVQVDVSAEELGAMLERGWRRFGPVYFRPACVGCGDCITLRIPTATFVPSKSMRRARKNVAEQLVRSVGRPIVDDERLELYRRWHEHREVAKEWEPSSVDAERYGFDFAFKHPSVREVAFRTHAGALVAIGIVDAVPGALSAVYFYWDPTYVALSLGTAHIVMLLDEAKERGLDYVYLGYWVAASSSLAYKARFGPHELLEGRPSERSLPIWNKKEEP